MCLTGARARDREVTMDALYFRVSSDRQTTQNQFEDLLQVAEKDATGGRDWDQIRQALVNCVYEEQRGTAAAPTHPLYRLRPEIAADLADQCIYVEQGKSAKAGARRPLFARMKRDAAVRKFDRLLVWKVSRLGRDMREVISTVYELADLGVTVVPVNSQTGPINSTMGKLLWAIQAWYAEMENGERADAIRSDRQGRARRASTWAGRSACLIARRLSDSAIKSAYHGRKSRGE